MKNMFRAFALVALLATVAAPAPAEARNPFIQDAFYWFFGFYPNLWSNLFFDGPFTAVLSDSSCSAMPCVIQHP